MTSPTGTPLDKSALRLLSMLADTTGRPLSADERFAGDEAALIAADLACKRENAAIEITAAGRAYLARLAAARSGHAVDPFRAQHLDIVVRSAKGPDGQATLAIDESESPLAWLARRTGRDGRALIEAHQFQAGERLRADFTRAQVMPRTTSHWQAPVARDRRSGSQGMQFTEAAIAARQRLRRALDAVGPEFAGLLIDICCFLKSLADIERERSWPQRSAKVVLQLALDRLARHYGYAAEISGSGDVQVRTWLAADANFVVE